MKSYLLSLGLTILYTPRWLIPPAITLILHFVAGISLWWTLGAVILILAVVFLRHLLLRSLNRAGNLPEKKTINKNPYSSKGYKPVGKDD